MSVPPDARKWIAASSPSEVEAHRYPLQPTREATEETGSVPGEMSEYELLEILDQTDPAASLYLVEMTFDRDNPMNTVGGIQVFAALKEIGTVVASEPDLDSLYEDRFHETVRYYLTTSEDASRIEKRATVADVTLGSEVTTLKVGEASDEEAVTGVPTDGGAIRTRKRVVARPSAPGRGRQRRRGKFLQGNNVAFCSRGTACERRTDDGGGRRIGCARDPGQGEA